MISARHRFHGYNSLNKVYKTGTMSRGPLFSVKSTLNPKRKTYRVAVVVSKKVHKSAVKRNRMRRRLYEAIRLLEPEILGPHDVVINVFSENLINEPHSNLVKLIKKQFIENKIIA